MQDKIITTLLIFSSDEIIAKEIETVCYTALGILSLLFQSPYVVFGAGTTELLLSQYLKTRSSKLQLSHKQMVAIDKICDCIQELVYALALTGSNKLNYTKQELIELLLDKNSDHNILYGWDIDKQQPMITFQDNYSNAIIDLLLSKKQAIISALETAMMVLRCDKIII